MFKFLAFLILLCSSNFLQASTIDNSIKKALYSEGFKSAYLEILRKETLTPEEASLGFYLSRHLKGVSVPGTLEKLAKENKSPSYLTYIAINKISSGEPVNFSVLNELYVSGYEPAIMPLLMGYFQGSYFANKAKDELYPRYLMDAYSSTAIKDTTLYFYVRLSMDYYDIRKNIDGSSITCNQAFEYMYLSKVNERLKEKSLSCGFNKSLMSHLDLFFFEERIRQEEISSDSFLLVTDYLFKRQDDLRKFKALENFCREENMNRCYRAFWLLENYSLLFWPELSDWTDSNGFLRCEAGQCN